MRIKARGYEGLLIELGSFMCASADISSKAIDRIVYTIVILCDDNAKVELGVVAPSEIEVLT